MTQEFKQKVLKESLTYTESSDQSAFEDGVCFALNNIWHDTREVPKFDNIVVLRYIDGVRSCQYCGQSMQGVLGWCYLEDILPKEK